MTTAAGVFAADVSVLKRAAGGAAAAGLSAVMLVAVTPEEIVLMDWHGTAASGTGPTTVLASFARARTQISETKFGATRKVTLVGQDRMATISGTLGLLSSGREGKHDVLRALGLD